MRKISYNKLWKLLIDKNMNKQDLKTISGINAASIAKLGKGNDITPDVLLKICNALDCNLEDILETVQINNMKEEYNDFKNLWVGAKSF